MLEITYEPREVPDSSCRRRGGSYDPRLRIAFFADSLREGYQPNLMIGSKTFLSAQTLLGSLR